ncbi:transcriptional regulator [Burkholderia sp. WAC0059]|uniref:anti-sigma factor family protein n=1 Tax=Burkholderia sp. WAC0059 TaxID=2066022 RepID=UPI000C7EC8B5|nr:anti-sigma factor [Burkholderia sp. WAC0059]PLZ01932.1 transcriptional regulator [Burkholderia sp. WAC0059]
MNQPSTTITDDDLHAYVDGSLPDERRAAVEAALDRDPALAARVSDYFALNQMFHERFDRVLGEPVPARLAAPAAARRGWRAANLPRFGAQFAGLAAALVLGIGIGTETRIGSSLMQPVRFALQGNDDNLARMASADSPASFAKEAALAHVVYMPAVQRPSDMDSGHEDDFSQWMSAQLGTDTHAPVLTAAGFELTGGRMLPGHVAQYMYRSAKGERLTVCVAHRDTSADTTAFQFYEDGPVRVFYWVDGKFGYAVSGGLPKSELLSVSHDIYGQLTGRS